MSTPSPPEEIHSGLVLGGKYRLEAEIGRGAMGSVWRAVHESLDQHVAIKIISRDHANSQELRRRFDNEARAAAKLRSRFVVGVTDNGETDDGLPYIVMEYLEGECLEDRIARMGSISLTEAARIARHVVRALSRAHACGIVHRDLKPANIFISNEDEGEEHDWIAKVLDFGIAKMDDFGDRSTTKTGTVLGTPLFMSPEQVRGASRVDSRADLYSLGMVIFNMLTGTYAFEGKSFGDLLVSICTDKLPQLSRRAPGVPTSLDDWFARACARNPEDRYQTADDLLVGFQMAIGEDSLRGESLSRVDVTNAARGGDAPPLAATYASEDTANTGTPNSAEELTESSLGDSSGAGASAVTVHDKSGGRQAGRTTALLFGGMSLAALIGMGIAMGSGEDEPSSTEELSGSSTNADTEETAPQPEPLNIPPPPEEPSEMKDSAPETAPSEDEGDENEADEEDPSTLDEENEQEQKDEAKAEASPPPRPKPVVRPRPRPVSRPAPRPAPSPPVVAPKPTPRPSSGEPDVGF